MNGELLQRVALDVRQPSRRTYPLARLFDSNNGLPARFTILVRHHDWADDRSISDAQAETEHVFKALDGNFARLASESLSIMALSEVLTRTNQIAATFDSCFSAVVGLLGTHLALAAVGDVSVHSVRNANSTDLVSPAVLRLPGRSSRPIALTACLGRTFAPESVQSCDVDLEHTQAVIVAVDGQQASIQQKHLHGPREMLNEIKNQADASVLLIIAGSQSV